MRSRSLSSITGAIPHALPTISAVSRARRIGEQTSRSHGDTARFAATCSAWRRPTAVKPGSPGATSFSACCTSTTSTRFITQTPAGRTERSLFSGAHSVGRADSLAEVSRRRSCQRSSRSAPSYSGTKTALDLPGSLARHPYFHPYNWSTLGELGGRADGRGPAHGIQENPTNEVMRSTRSCPRVREARGLVRHVRSRTRCQRGHEPVATRRGAHPALSVQIWLVVRLGCP